MGANPRWAFVGALFVALIVQGLFHAAALVTDGDSEGSHLYHGWLIVHGQLGLYDDQMTGHRTPFAYWLIGLAQVLVGGPSLWAGRVASLGAGLAGVAILWRTAHRAFGPPFGAITLCLVATSPYILGHFALAAFTGLAFLWVALGAWFLLASESPWRRAAVMLCAWGLFLTRPQFALLLPVAAWWALWGPGRTISLLAMILPGVTFFLAFRPGVWKMLAYVPLTQDLAADWGYIPAVLIGDPDWGSRLWRASALVLRSYKGWLVLAVTGWALWPLGFPALPRKAWIGIGVLGLFGLTQLALTNVTWKVSVGYFPAFILLAALPLAVRWSALLNGVAGSARRTVSAAILGGVLLLAPAASPPPSLPLAVDPWNTSAEEVRRAARELAVLIPPGTPVLLYGPATALHLAGLRPPIQPANHLETLTPMPIGTSPARSGKWTMVERSGLWSWPQIVDWLDGSQAYPWAIVWEDGLRARITPYGLHREATTIFVLLERHYQPVRRIGQHPGIVLTVYRRNS